MSKLETWFPPRKMRFLSTLGFEHRYSISQLDGPDEDPALFPDSGLLSSICALRSEDLYVFGEISVGFGSYRAASRKTGVDCG